MTNIVIAGYARSPFTQAGKGALARVRPDDLTAQVIRGLIERTGVDASQIEDIWVSPPIPESGIVIREDLDPALKEKLRSFFLTYGQGQGPDADSQRQVLAGLNYSMFRAADDSYLDPVREMVADQKLSEARAKNDQAGVAAAERDLAALRTKREVQP